MAKLQWTFGGPTRGLSPWATATCARPAVEQRCRDDRRLFRADLGDAEADRAGRRTRPGADHHRRQVRQSRDHRRGPLHLQEPASKRGVEIFEYQPTKLHSKLVVLDDVVHIGSSNFDIRSLYLNLEMMLRVDDPASPQLMRDYFEG